jgi:hypothetical protein
MKEPNATVFILAIITASILANIVFFSSIDLKLKKLQNSVNAIETSIDLEKESENGK